MYFSNLLSFGFSFRTHKGGTGYGFEVMDRQGWHWSMSAGWLDSCLVHRCFKHIETKKKHSINSNGLQPKSNGLQPNSNGLQSKSNGLQPKSNGLQPNSNGLQPNVGCWLVNRSSVMLSVSKIIPDPTFEKVVMNNANFFVALIFFNNVHLIRDWMNTVHLHSPVRSQASK